METSDNHYLESETANSETVSLKNIFLHVTNACNLRCVYCNFSEREPLPDEMTADEFTKLWSDFVAVSPEKVVVTGGEPLLRADIFDLLNSLREADKEHNILRCLNSNGHLVKKDLARRLVGLADEVRVSIDALETRNDTLRGAGNFAAAMRALEIYYSVGFEPKVLVTVTSQSLPDLEELICLLIEKKLTRINLNGFRPIGRGRGHWELMVNPDDVCETLKRVRNAECGMRNDFFGDDNIAHDETQSETANAYTTTTPHSAFRTPHLNCGVGSFLNIMPNGDVFPCHVLTDREFRCGNLREQSLVEICSRNGLLGRFSMLNFQDLAKEDSQLSELKNQTVCLGNVYAQTRSLPVWKNNLKLN